MATLQKEAKINIHMTQCHCTNKSLKVTDSLTYKEQHENKFILGKLYKAEKQLLLIQIMKIKD